MATRHTEERIGEAWRLHRNGDHKAAIDIFQDILTRKPKDIDVHYGLGLCHRANGNPDAAIESFHEALRLGRDAFRAVRTTSETDGLQGSNDLDTTEDDRYLMLVRMTKQRLAEMGLDVNPNVTGASPEADNL